MEMNSQSAEMLKKLLVSSSRAVFFGGAGTSTESRIPDFRSAAGLYQTKTAGAYPPETMLSRSFFLSHTEEFYEFYVHHMIYPDAEPNQAHMALAELESQGKLTAVITQNIDGLHQKAGSRHVIELHGSVHRNTCMSCGTRCGLETILQANGAVPRCSCGGIIKPDVVLYEESLDSGVLQAAVEEISRSDLLIVGGTSLTVNPAAGLIRYYRGEHLVLINQSATAYDSSASLVIRERIGEVLGQAVFGGQP